MRAVLRAAVFGGLFGLLYGAHDVQFRYRKSRACELPMPTLYLWKDPIACAAINKLHDQVKSSPRFVQFMAEMDKLVGMVVTRTPQPHKIRARECLDQLLCEDATRKELHKIIEQLTQALRDIK
jgi:hypothetical protein